MSSPEKQKTAVEFINVEMSYPGPDGTRSPVFNLKEYVIADGGQVAVMGPSGSGKTTLLHMIAGIRLPDQGSVNVNGVDITCLSESERDAWRGNNLGYIFQNYYLFPALTLLENTVMPLAFAGWKRSDRISRAREILRQLELDHRLAYYPNQLSSGEKQRAVIARALVIHPKILLADEPSANLDAKRRQILITLLKELAAHHQSTLLVATHDRELASMFPIQMEIEKFK